MPKRLARYLMLHLVTGLAGWWLAALPGTLVAVLIASGGWLGLDLWRTQRVLGWLQRNDWRNTPVRRGPWGEVVDRTQRLVRQFQADQQNSQTRLQDFLAAIQTSPNGVILLDDKGHIEWCNHTAAGHFGIQMERDQQQLIGNLVRDPVFAAYMASKDVSHEIGIPGRGDNPARPVRLSVQLHPYRDGSGSDKRLLLSRDVTALEQADAMRRDFVANVSHEIRTPLTVLAGFIETLQTLPLEASERHRYLDLMALQSERMQILVNDLLTLSRLEGSPLPTLHEWTPLVSLMAQCAQDASALSARLGRQATAQ
ncbi:MAG: phosphate regulon sensor histidine kinase PhoR, partial [Pseudomonadota bacterium]